MGFNTFIWEQCCLNPGLGGIRDVTSAIISHKQTRSNRACCFQTLDAVFPKDLYSDYFEKPDMGLFCNMLFPFLSNKKSSDEYILYLGYFTICVTSYAKLSLNFRYANSMHK